MPRLVLEVYISDRLAYEAIFEDEVTEVIEATMCNNIVGGVLSVCDLE